MTEYTDSGVVEGGGPLVPNIDSSLLATANDFFRLLRVGFSPPRRAWAGRERRPSSSWNMPYPAWRRFINMVLTRTGNIIVLVAMFNGGWLSSWPPSLFVQSRAWVN